ncbi:MAG: response regulator, partial [Paucibacter sp.]|nr:response regulator [Roseateles sp.]
ANMSHELRTQLNSIIVLSKMMGASSDGQVNGEALKWAGVIHRSGQDLLHLINDVLDLSKVEAGRMDLVIETVRSDELCGELQGLFEPLAAESGVALVVDDQLKDAFQTDEAKLSQILRNLLTNAFKFCKQGSVTLSLRRGADSRRPLRFCVRDTGIGIPKDKLGLIFEAFKQADGSTSREYGGTGLGLTISQRFAELLGGTIEVHSEEGRGSEFCVLLPERLEEVYARSGQAVAAAARESMQVDERDSLSEGDLSILLIDDDTAFGQALLALNRGLGYKTLLAATGAQGIQMARRYRPRGILLDLGLPDMDGSRVLHELKSDRELASIPVYIVSARDRDETMLRQGAVGFLQKPAEPQRLAEIQAELLALVDTADGARLLVLENGGITAQSLQDLLGGRAMRVEAATDGAALGELFRASQRAQDPYRLVVLDVSPLPGEGVSQALAWARSLRALAADLPLVFHCRQPLPPDEEAPLRQLSSCLIMASQQAAPRLLANVERFLREVPREALGLKSTAHATLDGKALSDHHVLVVDDDPRNIFVMTAALERQGARVSTAINGKRALEFLAKETVDVILMDVMMPEMDGFEAMTHIRADARIAQTPVIVISAKAAAADRAKAMRMGANDYLSKPIDYDMLVAMVRRWCKG